MGVLQRGGVVRVVIGSLSAVLMFIAGVAAGAGDGMPRAWMREVAGATRVVSVAGSLAFGAVPLGDHRTVVVTIVNFGNAPLSVRGLHVTGGLQAHMVADWSSGTIPAGAAQPVRIRFVPFLPGPFRGFVSVIGDQTSGAGTLAMSATVTEGPADDGVGNLWRVTGVGPRWVADRAAASCRATRPGPASRRGGAATHYGPRTPRGPRAASMARGNFTWRSITDWVGSAGSYQISMERPGRSGASRASAAARSRCVAPSKATRSPRYSRPSAAVKV